MKPKALQKNKKSSQRINDSENYFRNIFDVASTLLIPFSRRFCAANAPVYMYTNIDKTIISVLASIYISYYFIAKNKHKFQV